MQIGTNLNGRRSFALPGFSKAPRAPAPLGAAITPTILALWDQLLAAKTAADTANLWDAAELGAPAVTQLSGPPASGITVQHNGWAQIGQFRFVGGVPIQIQGNANKAGIKTMGIAQASGNLAEGNAVETSVAIEFNTTEPKICFMVQRQLSTRYRIALNDRYVTRTPLTYGAGDGTFSYVQIDSGGAALGKVRLEIEKGAIFTRVYSASATAFTPTADGLARCVVGDSLAAANTATMMNNGWASIAGLLDGMADSWQQGYGGSGLINPGPNGVDQKLSATGTMDQVSLRAGGFGEVVVQCGPNDDTTAASWRTAIGTLIAGLRSRLPNALITFAGYFPNSGTPNAIKATAEGVMADVIAEIGDPNVMLVRMASDPNGPCIMGTGWTGGTTGDGNADLYVSTSDKVHYNDAGYEVLGRRFSLNRYNTLAAKRAAA